MKLGTFQVRTQVGRFSRLGIFTDGLIIDANFGFAWYMRQQGEAEPQVLADAHLPSTMLDYLRAGDRALHNVRELISRSGPPAYWWKDSSPPRGPNDETLVYRPDEVRLRAPLPNPVSVRDFYAFE